MGIAFADRLGIRKHIFRDHGITTDVSVSTDSAELMYAGESSDRRMIFNVTWPASVAALAMMM